MIELRKPAARGLAWMLINGMMTMPLHAAQTNLADAPVGTIAGGTVPVNVMFTLSVEWPTAVSVAHLGDYDSAQDYLGIFDSYKCYDYKTAQKMFTPAGYTTGVTAKNGILTKAGIHTCSGKWSGNYLNWATMQTIDTFRVAMTGGDRLVDTAVTTVIQKALATGQGGSGMFPTKTIDKHVSDVTPLTWGSLSVHIQSLGRVMRYGSDADLVSDDTLDGSETEMTVAVAVCTGGMDARLNVSLNEDNCVKYGSIYKPEGLIQKNSGVMRFGVMSYLSDDNPDRDGGVLRAQVKSVGARLTGGSDGGSANAQQEWDSATGILVLNPDLADASDSNVTNSGVINYINKFGAANNRYKTYDNVSEMYYAALRYLRNMGTVPEWQSNLTTEMKDGFPVITKWKDPYQHSCQKSVTVGIGDIYTHRDRNVPGGANLMNLEPRMETLVASDKSVADAREWTAKIGSNENSGDYDDPLEFIDGESNYIAGLAYWAHTQDIRPDLQGRQSVDFYWADVMERQLYASRNMYWLGAKYGGFTDLDGDGKPGDESEWRKNKSFFQDPVNKLPDNYFAASNPKLMLDGLTRTFAAFYSDSDYNTKLRLSSSVIASAGVSGYISSYNTSGWVGDIKGYAVVPDSSTTVSASPVFSAKIALDAQAAGTGWSTSRNLVTGRVDKGVFSAVPFRTASLSTDQVAALDSDSYYANKILSFVRGDRSNEGSLFRSRVNLLGSIVDGGPAVVKPPAAGYSEVSNPGYSAFRAKYSARKTVVLAGSNDGILHAFDGTLNATSGGHELWGYVPSMLLTGLGTSGLSRLTDKTYIPRYLVNGPIRVQDVDFRNDGGGASGDWHTIAIAGLGKGGNSFVGIDVTDPSVMQSETGIASKILWEFTDPDMGNSFGAPRVFKTAKFGWVVALSSGYNNASGTGHVWLLRPKTGEVLATLNTNEGESWDPIGLAQLGAFIPDLSDYSSDAIYGGDLKGNVWRWDLTSSASTVDAVKIATLTAPDGTPQSVTTEPSIEVIAGSQQRMVFVGTGRYLADTDTAISQVQSIYGLRDGHRDVNWTSSTTPAGLSFPYKRGQFQQVSDLTVGILQDDKKAGWFYDLTGGTKPVNERIIVAPAALGGQVVFISLMPPADPCGVGGASSRVYALNESTGGTLLTVPYLSTDVPAVTASIVGIGSNLTLVVALSSAVTTSAALPGGATCSGNLCQIGLHSASNRVVRRLSARAIRPNF